MGIFVSVGTDHTIFESLVTELLKRKPTPGTNNKQSEINAAAHAGVLDGLRVALAALATEERIKLLKDLNLVAHEGDRPLGCPQVSHFDLHNFTRDLKTRWDAGDFKDVEDEVFFKQQWELFFGSVVWNEDFINVYKGYRKDAVLAGRIDPTEADLEWLKAEHDNFKAIVSPYEQALAKLHPNQV